MPLSLTIIVWVGISQALRVGGGLKDLDCIYSVNGDMLDEELGNRLITLIAVRASTIAISVLMSYVQTLSFNYMLNFHQVILNADLM